MNDISSERNLTMMTDLYQLTMMYGYYRCGMDKNEAVFDLFFRQRDNSAYAIMAGTEQPNPINIGTKLLPESPI